MDTQRIRRAVIQILEDQQRAGLTHWNCPPVQQVESNVQASPQSATSSSKPVRLVAEQVQLSNQVPQSARHAVEDRKVIEMETKPEQTPVLPMSSTFVPLDLPLDQRVKNLQEVAERVRQCTRCSELACSRTQTVFGVGNPQARILFLGEAPGADEDAQGEPFVGRSGQLLNDIIKACRIRREDVYICNILRCRPPGNRLPSPTESANCREYLESQLATVNPEYIVCLGACAAQNLLGSKESIGKLRSKFHQFGRSKVMCTYHPSYLLRNPAAKKDVWEDMKRLFLDMGIDLAAKPTN